MNAGARKDLEKALNPFAPPIIQLPEFYKRLCPGVANMSGPGDKSDKSA